MISELFDTRLSLKLQGPSITMEAFRDAISAFTGVLQESASMLCGDDGGIEWIVDVVPGSVVVNVEARSALLPPFRIHEVTDHVGRGLKSLSEGNVPSFFSDGALRYAARLASLSGCGGATTALHVQIQAGQSVVHLSVAQCEMIESYLDRALIYQDWGSVEGVVTSLSLAKGYHFSISDVLLDGLVRCSFDPGLLSLLLKAFGRRVSVSGLLYYNETGRIKRVDTEEIEIFKDDSELPTASDVRGILAGAL